MSFVLEALKLYGLVGLFLGVAYLVFYLFQRTGIPMTSRHQLRLAQALLLSALLFPLLAQVPGLNPLTGSLRWKAALSAESFSVPSDFGGKRAAVPRAIKFERGSASGESQWEKPNASWLTSESLTLACLAALLLGFLLRGFRLFQNILDVRALLAAATPVRKLGRVRVVISDETHIPFSTLISGAACVALPACIVPSRRNFRIALEHEIQHHRQGDTLWILFSEALKLGFYWNPLLFLWTRRIEELQEFACDEALIVRRRISLHEYGSCLLTVAEASLKGERTLVAAAGMATSWKSNEGHSLLKRRIQMLPQYQVRRTNFWLALASIGFTTAALGVAAFASTGVSSDNSPDRAPDVNPVIQKIAEDALVEAVGKWKAASGSAIVEDSNTGVVLAVAKVEQSEDGKGWLRTRDDVLSQEFEPGSVVKPIIASSAVEQGRISFEEIVDTGDGKYRYGSRVHHDWKSHGFGKISAASVIIQSSSIGSIKIAERLGPSGLAQAFKDFGFGAGGSSAGFPSASPGHLPLITDHESEEQFLPNVAGGYVGFFTTPLEIVQSFVAIANGGKLLKPLELRDQKADPVIVRRLMSAKTAELTRGVLIRAVREGTGKNAVSRFYSTGGKTGTMTKRDQRMIAQYQPDNKDTAHFVGFAPATNPRLVVYVIIDEPEGRGHGNQHAAPVFTRIIDQSLKVMGVSPDL